MKHIQADETRNKEETKTLYYISRVFTGAGCHFPQTESVTTVKKGVLTTTIKEQLDYTLQSFIIKYDWGERRECDF